jgi:uncharacterized membrane protein YeaQ/YmgE (transglycosylase-associated protein family)
MTFLLIIAVGAATGWQLAARIMKAKSYGLYGNIGIGIAGALIGGYVFGFHEGLILRLIAAFLIAAAALWGAAKVKK